MYRLLAASMLLFATLTGRAQSQPTSDYDKVEDAQNGAVVYKGACTVADLQKEPSFGWLGSGMKTYKPDAAAVKYLKQYLPEYNIVVLMGTWCDDSQLQLPRLFKTLQAAGYPLERVQMYGVDRKKEAKYVEHRLYHLERVPTIMLYKGHQEIGRIVEAPKKSIEADLAALVKSQEEGAAK